MFLKEINRTLESKFAKKISDSLSKNSNISISGNTATKTEYNYDFDCLKNTIYYGRVYSRKCYADGFLGAAARKINYFIQFFAWFIGQSAGQRADRELKGLITNEADKKLIAPLLANILESFSKNGDYEALEEEEEFNLKK